MYFKHNQNVTPHNLLMEDSQDAKIQFAFLEKLDDVFYTNITAWCKCRDFINDAFFIQQESKKHNKIISKNIYGFEYTSRKNLELNTLGIISPDIEELKNIEKNFNTFKIKNFENHFFPTNTNTVITYVPEFLTGHKMLVIEPNDIWLSNTYTLSLFTLILRFCCYKRKHENIWESTLQQHNSERYLIETIKTRPGNFNKILFNLDKLPNPIKSLDIFEDSMSYIHNRLGILNLIFNDDILCLGDKECPADVNAAILS